MFTRNLPRTESYITSKNKVKASLGHYSKLNVNFGLQRKFEFDSRSSNKPIIKGPVVVSVSIARSGEITASFYPIATSELPEDAAIKFDEMGLQTISRWIDGVIRKPETAIVGVEQFIVEIEGDSIKFHQMTFL